MEGEYCLVDREWRSSLGCSILGVLLVVGSEESVFTMIIITFMRMKMVFWYEISTLLISRLYVSLNSVLYRRPHSNASLKRVYAGILATWILSFAIALVPLIPGLEDYFVDNVWLEYNLRIHICGL